ncbi:MAG TPA: hypothetical protein VGF75_06300 [Candidatus Saccharimonadales bacterium]|jgi:hypothetical protein
MSSATKIKTPQDWANAQLGNLGIQDSSVDVNDLVNWWQHEGGAGPQFGVANNDDNYNPINTTQDEPGAVSTNSSGVKSYTSWQQGLDATSQTLESPDYGYPKIIADLTDNAPQAQFDQDVTASSWGTNLSGTTADPSATPNNNSYDTGVDAANNAGSAANAPSTATNATPLSGFAGVLQTLDSLYNPAGGSLDWNPLSVLTAIPKDVESVTIEVFVRGVSSILALGLIFMGIRTFLSGEGTGGSSGSNVLEFVNNAKVQNARTDQSERRLQLQERESSRKSAKPRVRVKYVERGKVI